MKKLILLTVAVFFIFSGSHIGHAKTYWRTFEVAEITDQGIILMDFEGGKFLVNKDPKDLKVGDIVRYDTVKNRLKKSPWQPATVLKMTESMVTLQMKNGDNIDVNMKSSYRNEFNEGDAVNFNISQGQIKKSNLQPVE